MKNKQIRVIVGMSGGVDSSVSAWILKQQGYDVIGLFMRNWDDTDELGVCTATEEFADVRRVCSQIGIPYYSISLEKEYKQKVFQHFLDEYRKGRTPNPDILCNQEIKFGDFLSKAKQLGAHYIATGHYAQIIEKNGEKVLVKGKDFNKDQSYFLYAVKREHLLQAIFPIGHLLKAQVRQIAKQIGLSTAEKKESMGICFIGKRDFRPFLSNYLPAQPGEIRSLEGKYLGKHDGLVYYTLGQRQGLGIGGERSGSGEPWFVVKKDLKNNILYVVQGHNHEALFTDHLITAKINWLLNGPVPTLPFECKAKCRYRQEDQSVVVHPKQDETYHVEFKKPQRAITPGQSVVFYDGDICLGGGIIEETF